MSADHLSVHWRPAPGSPLATHVPNPAYPRGMDIDATNGAPGCATVDIPYPAPCRGLFVIECSICDYRFGLTAAGRADDPRTLKFACRLGGLKPAGSA